MARPRIESDSKEAGFDRHLTKPVEPAVLYELLAELSAVKDPHGTG